MRVAIIPARGGSKRVPHKNVRPFAGVPIIAFAISVARQSGVFDHVVVSTEDEEVAHVASLLGAEVPFVRPARLAGDHVPTVPVVAHAVRECEAMGWGIDTVCCIYPAVPFLLPSDIVGALALLDRTSAEYSFLVAEFPSNPQRALLRDEYGFVAPLFPDNELRRTQDLRQAYFDAGQLYWGTNRAWLTNPRVHSNGVGHPIPSWRAVDIDTEDDWRRAELLFASLNMRLP